MASISRGPRVRPIAAAVAVAFGSTAPLAVSGYPVGEEFRVNTTTDNHQQLPDAAMDADGNFVVVFQNHLPVTNANVAAQRYNAAGQPQGDEFQVNTTASSGNTFPAVAMDDDGDFVVVWMDFGDDGSGYGVFGQRYNAAGTAQGANFPVNATTANAQRRPDVAMDADGDFVVVWEDDQFGDSHQSIKAQRFSAQGAAVGGEIDVSTDADVDQVWPQVAMDDAGNFTVAWASGNVGADQDVAFRIFEANGNPRTAAIQVNTTTRMDHASGVLNNLSVGMSGSGDIAIAWRADNFSGPGTVGAAIGVLGRLYDSDGDPKGDAFTIDSRSAATLGKPEIAMTRDGDFVVAYEGPDGSLSGTRIQRFYANGDPKGASFVANSSTELGQTRPHIAVDDDANAIVVWQDGNGLDGDLSGTYGLRLSGAGVQSAMDFNNDFNSDIGLRNLNVGANRLWLMEQLDQLEAGPIGRLPDLAWQVAGVCDFDRDGNADILWRDSALGRNRIWFMDGFERLSARSIPTRNLGWHVAGVGDIDRDGKCDIVWRSNVAGSFVAWLMDGATRKDDGTIGKLHPDWETAAVADFNGDGRTDLLFRHSGDGRNLIWLLDGFSREIRSLPRRAALAWTVAGAGDFDRDGDADIVWRIVTTGQNLFWELEDGFFVDGHPLNALIGADWRVVGVRDFSRDDYADLLWRNATDGRMRIWQISDFTRDATKVLPVVNTSWKEFGED